MGQQTSEHEHNATMPTGLFQNQRKESPGKARTQPLGEQVQGYPTYLSPGNGKLLFTLLTVRGFIVFQPSMALRRKEHHRIPLYGLVPDEPFSCVHPSTQHLLSLPNSTWSAFAGLPLLH